MKDDKKDFDKIKEELIKKGTQDGSEELVKKRFFDYFKKHQKDISFSAQIEKIYELLVSGTLNKTDKALIVGALIYFINPFDLVPDLTPVLGFLDDMTVVGLVYRYLSNRSHDLEPQKTAEKPTKKSGKKDNNA